jgi:hypothetical protein
MEILIAAAGVIVMAMVVGGMILLTPSGTMPVRESFADDAGQGGDLSPHPATADDG